MWSVGALLELDDRAKMEEFARGNFELDLPPIAEGSQDTIFEFLVNETGSLLHPASIILQGCNGQEKSQGRTKVFSSLGKS